MKILIILAHPSRKRETLCQALAQAYYEEARKSGHDTVLYKIADKQFDPILHEGYAEEQPAEPDIADAREKVLWAEHIVFVYPLWQFMIPALLKCFLERTFTKGFAFDVDAGTKKMLMPLKGKSVRIIQTSGMPGLIYRFYYGAHGAKALRDMAGFCGMKPVRASYFGMVEAVSDEQRKQWLSDIRGLASRGC